MHRCHPRVFQKVKHEVEVALDPAAVGCGLAEYPGAARIEVKGAVGQGTAEPRNGIDQRMSTVTTGAVDLDRSFDAVLRSS